MKLSLRDADSTLGRRFQGCFKIGEKVQALWSDGRYYPATVTSVETGVVNVTFLDGFKRRCKDFHIKRSHPRNKVHVDDRPSTTTDIAREVSKKRSSPITDLVDKAVQEDKTWTSIGEVSKKRSSPITDLVVRAVEENKTWTSTGEVSKKRSSPITDLVVRAVQENKTWTSTGEVSKKRSSAITEFKNKANAALSLVGSQDMLIRKNFTVLSDAISAYTLSDTEVTKAGLKMALFYLIKKFAKIQRAVSLMNDDDEKAEEIEKFLEVLSLNGNFIFGDATYTLNRRRQTTLRKPDKLPLEDDVVRVKEYTVNRISAIVKDAYKIWDLHLYSELRDLAVSRLTLFNGRRGGEPARLLVTEWEDAENGTWLDPARIEKLPDNEASLFSSMLITYQGGKGNNHLVPVLIPTDTCDAMRLLSDKHVRELSSVHVQNRYMFPCTQQSETHVGGWHSVNRVCQAAEVVSPDRLTATSMRHRVSTLYAGIEMSDGDRQLFYKHMGHSSAMNENVYQTPRAEAEILKVGSNLNAMDGHNSTIIVSKTGTTEAAMLIEQLNNDTLSTAVTTSTQEATLVERSTSETVAETVEQTFSGTTEANITGRNTQLKTQSKERDYYHWTTDANNKVNVFFAKWLTGDGLPGKRDILVFLEQNPSIAVNWNKVYTKIFNEKKTLKLRQEKMLKKLQIR